MKETLFAKVLRAHTVRTLPSGEVQILIGTHLIHEVTSPQAFPMIRDHEEGVRFPENTFATVDHIVPTTDQSRPLSDPLAEIMLQHLEANTKEFGILFFGLGHKNQGVVHVMAPEIGLIQPGMTVACGDSHTSTHGAFGTIAIGVGTTQIACILASGCMLMEPLKVRRINVNGELGIGVTPKDIILAIIRLLGVKGGIGYVYEYGGDAIDRLGMEGRMTICNMSIEGGAKCGYINPDQTTIEYLQGREYSPTGEEFEEAAERWLDFASDEDAEYDDVVNIDAASIQPMMTWGINPGQSIGVSQSIPENALPEALAYMQLEAGESLLGKKVDVAFIGSCTNGRIDDLREAADLIDKYKLRVSPEVKALVVPGSVRVRRQAEEEGLHLIFIEAGWEWREAGCSMCLAMNPDQLIGDQLCASSSNRNFKGRQGSPTGRTILMSPASVVACASRGFLTDVRTLS